MKKLAFGALLVGLLVACGGGSDKNKNVVVVDMMTVDAPGVCNPLTQAGCAANEKCTWLLDALMPQYVGHIGCAPDGTANPDEACNYGMPGATGYDMCKKGSVCGNYRGGAGVCKQICDQQGGTPACDAQHVCVTYSGLFTTGETTPNAAGVCDRACDPILDNDFDGAATASMKGSNTCGNDPAVGCYGYPSQGSPPATGWSCTSDINSDVAQPTGLRHRVQCTDTNMCAAPTIYINSCNQGYLPLLYETTGVMTVICTAMCIPLDCYGGNCGTNNINRMGDATKKGRCNTTDRVGTFSNGGAADGGTTGGEHCRYLWSFELDQQGTYLPSPTSDKMGFCFDHSKYRYDSNMDNMPDKELPNCGLLSQPGTGSGTSPADPLTYFGAGDLGCTSTTTAGVMANKKVSPEMARKIQDTMPRLLYGRTMGTR